MICCKRLQSDRPCKLLTVFPLVDGAARVQGHTKETHRGIRGCLDNHRGMLKLSMMGKVVNLYVRME